MKQFDRSKLYEGAGWLVAALALAGLVASGYVSNRDRHAHAISADGCLAFLPAPGVLAVATDVTDPLEDAQPRRWRTSVTGEIGLMPPGTKLLFADISAAVPAEMTFMSAPCVPPPGRGVLLDKIQATIKQKLDAAEEHLKDAKPMKASAIRRTLLAIATDSIFKATKTREILALSDFLESDGSASAYRRKGLVLPPAIGKPFAGVTLHMIVMKNLRDARFQTPALIRSWIGWAQAAGARVIVDAPELGFSSPNSTQTAGGTE